ncbi:methyltransferase [Streptomyces sp. ML-6]|uniref:class I SAM-dependent methyltransferase n=1 Tax=Streptomyces sp. ML-6 TaxID=2982693 RepID=UPI0024BFF650|nr:methyltransferase [Streptomyces sp. ML-6]MDK0517985.1 class I SAM-dependent methyltransferase [Streptomyces sp. ML-6]
MTADGPGDGPEFWARLLASHPQVASARVVPGPEVRIEVVPEISVTETVEGWSYLFEDLYDSGADRGGDCGAPQLVGWVDGLTGEPVPAEQMREWVLATVGRVKALRPRRVLEIGAGTGLVMDELLAGADLDEYVATDLALASVEVLRSLGERRGSRTRVRVHHGAAHEELPASDGPGYDTVVLNSVAQYFPSTEYLEEVLSAAIGLMAPGGHIFLGDLRDATLMPSYYRRRSGETKADFDLERHQRRDFELSLSPDHVRSLANTFDAVTAVEAAPRRGRYHNEMSVFRFDAVLHLGCRPPVPGPSEPGGSGPPAKAVARHMDAGGGPAVWRGLSNSRLAGPGGDSVDPEALWDLGARRGWKVRVGCEPGIGSAALEVWAGPADAQDGHFGLSLPGGEGSQEPRQLSLPPGRTWTLLDALRTHLGPEAEKLESVAGGVRLPIRLAPRNLGRTAQEGDR